MIVVGPCHLAKTDERTRGLSPKAMGWFARKHQTSIEA